MAVINFRSSGELSTSDKFQSVINQKPIGFKTPLRLGADNDGVFGMHLGLVNQIQDNFRNLLLTNHGERLGKFDFGANLKELSFEMEKDEFDILAIQRIRTAINKFMPFLDPRTFESKFEGAVVAERAVIKIIYDVPRVGIAGKSIEVILSNGMGKPAPQAVVPTPPKRPDEINFFVRIMQQRSTSSVTDPQGDAYTSRNLING